LELKRQRIEINVWFYDKPFSSTLTTVSLSSDVLDIVRLPKHVSNYIVAIVKVEDANKNVILIDHNSEEKNY